MTDDDEAARRINAFKEVRRKDDPHLYQGSYKPPEHPDPSEVDDAATRRVEAWNEAQRQQTELDRRWTDLRALHQEPYHDAAHRRGEPPGFALGGQDRPPLNPRGWNNRRDDPNREDESVPPHQMPARGTVGFSRPGRQWRSDDPQPNEPARTRKPLDLTPAVERRTGGAGMSFADGAAAASAANTFANVEVGGAVRLIQERTESVTQAILLAKRSIENSIIQFLAAWGNLESAHLSRIIGAFNEMQDRLDSMAARMELQQSDANDILHALQVVEEATQEYNAFLAN